MNIDQTETWKSRTALVLLFVELVFSDLQKLPGIKRSHSVKFNYMNVADVSSCAVVIHRFTVHKLTKCDVCLVSFLVFGHFTVDSTVFVFACDKQT